MPKFTHETRRRYLPNPDPGVVMLLPVLCWRPAAATRWYCSDKFASLRSPSCVIKQYEKFGAQLEWRGHSCMVAVRMQHVARTRISIGLTVIY